MGPDNFREIFDTEDKFITLRTLSAAMDELFREVAKEHNYFLALSAPISFTDSRNSISTMRIPSL